jgi:predicted secreted protein
MKVYDLIKQLTRFPADAEVMFDARIKTYAMVKEIVETKDKENTYAEVEVEEEVSITDIDWLNKDVLIKLEK